MTLKQDKPEATPINLANLKKLRDYMAKLPDDYSGFDMSHYIKTGDARVSRNSTPLHAAGLKAEVACGTTCCLLGHGPAAGLEVPLPLESYACVTWTTYSRAAFGLSPMSIEGLEMWKYLFSKHWPSDLAAAIVRMDKVLASGGRFTPDMEKELQALGAY